ncbi:sodium-independent sulfate anion transporter isoform X5 [Cavia porcellus]|uniref:sodium-independent sulfate anion transporter isoform X5 n=1 Tax=Cavia porcellus TaxID=10141 RepID=UPI002FE15E47
MAATTESAAALRPAPPRSRARPFSSPSPQVPAARPATTPSDPEHPGPLLLMPSSLKGLGQAWLSSSSMALSACCSVSAWQKRLPVLAWLPRYSLQWLKMDFIAGLSVGLTVIPQALAYAEVAGLPPQYGLYSAFTGCFVYVFLGTSRDVTLGPTAIMSLLVSFYTFHEPAYAVLLTFLSGCIQLAMGLLHLGFLLDFISCPVIKGFTSAAAIIIGFGQIKAGRCHSGPGLHGAAACAEAHAGPHSSCPPRDAPLRAAQLWAGVDHCHSISKRLPCGCQPGAAGHRTAVNAQSGVCTPAGGLVTGALVLLSLDYLTSLFYYIPKAALAAVIIMAVVPLFDTKIFGMLWRVKRLDLLPLCATFLLCFWEVQYGILAGTLVSTLFLLHFVARPKTQVSEGPVLILQLASGLHFPAIETLRDIVLSRALEVTSPRPAVLECSHVCSIDYTVVLGLAGLLEDFRKQGVSLVFSGLQAPVLHTLLAADLKGFQNFPTLEKAEQYVRQELGMEPYNVCEDSVPEHKVTLLTA